MRDRSSIQLTVTWKQAALYEFALVSLGILVGSLWPDIFSGTVRWVLLIIFVVAGGYISLLWVHQNVGSGTKR